MIILHFRIFSLSLCKENIYYHWIGMFLRNLLLNECKLLTLSLPRHIFISCIMSSYRHTTALQLSADNAESFLHQQLVHTFPAILKIVNQNSNSDICEKFYSLTAHIRVQNRNLSTLRTLSNIKKSRIWLKLSFIAANGRMSLYKNAYWRMTNM